MNKKRQKQLKKKRGVLSEKEDSTTEEVIKY